ncbi:MAG TPA: S41 family peptidase [Rectinemataceae bacterium]|nr:S41 family peptidase [Rectinemataceae bacterium]
MKQHQGIRSKGSFAWSAMAAGLLLIMTISIAVPRAAAQTTNDQTQSSVQYFQTLEGVWQFIQRNYVDKVDPKILYQGAMKGMFDALGDPYSVFLDDKLMGGLNDTLEGSFGGVGLYISKQAPDPRLPADTPRYIEIVSPIEDTPGWKAGFKPGDLIMKIDGESTVPMSADDAMAKIRGKPGTKVTLHILRGKSAELDISVARAIIEVPAVRKGIIPTPKGDIGYIRIIDFTPQAVTRVKDAIDSFDKTGYRALILDVRSNPGGLLQSAVQIADFFIPSGTIVSTIGRIPQEDSVEKANNSAIVAPDKPMVVLIDHGSASASEILSGALKDQKRALIIGDRSYGKGVVQRVYPIDDSTGFKLTVSRYYTPSGGSINKTGITPDISAKDPELSDAETAEAQKLINSGKIANFADANPKATVAQRNAFAAEIVKSGVKLPLRTLELLIKNELMRDDVTTPFDLEFDTALQVAISTIDRPDYAELLAKAQTVKQHADEEAAAAKAGDKTAATAPAASSTN